MDYTDKETFRKEMPRMGRLAGRMVTVEDVDAYYKYLQHYKVETLSRAIDKAYRDRDPDDVFLNTQMLRANEIKTAADRILEIEGGEKTFGCPKCTGGWIVMERPDAQPIAARCECLLERIEANKKSRKGKAKK